jgi:ectoine hydroxylase-related dioxygenase (phytanoyl-CoA dioxygenase family)
MPVIATFTTDDPLDAVAAALDRDGAAIIRDVLSAQHLEALTRELRPHIDRSAPGLDDFSGRRSTRTGALVARSPACRELVAHPRVVEMCARVLLPACERFQVNVTQVIRLLPGQKGQQLHRDRGLWGNYLPEDIEPQLGTMWALNDFTAANGATRVAPGSNHWDPGREWQPHEVTAAEMPAGSLLLYTGSVIHGGGANVSSGERLGINVTYCLGWLRQEENQYLSCPPEICRTFDPRLQELLGYTMGAYALGYYSPLRGEPGAPDIAPPEHALGRLPHEAPRGGAQVSSGFVPVLKQSKV